MLRDIGDVFSDKEAYDTALEYYERARRILIERRDRDGELAALSGLLHANRQSGKIDVAVWMPRTLARAQDLGDRWREVRPLADLARAYEHAKRYGTAREVAE